MKIALVTPVLPPYAGGIGTVALQQARALLPLGYDVTIVTPDYGGQKMTPELPYKIDYIKPLKKHGNAAWVPGITKSLAGMDAVILHYPFFGGAEVVASWKRRHRRVPLVLYYHHDVVASGWKGQIFQWHKRWWLPRIVQAADALITTSADYGQQSYVAPWLTKEPERCFAVPNGVDTHVFYPLTPDLMQQVRENHQIDQGDQVILFVGGLDRAHYFKGVSYLLQAFQLLIQQTQRRDLKLVIVGEGDLRPEYENLAGQLEVAADVRFAGKVSADDLLQWYNTASVTVLPSVDASEAFGVVLIESMACGTPVIATALPGVRTVVAEGQTGLVVPPRDAAALAAALHTVVTASLEQQVDWRRASRERAEQYYDWRVVIRQLTHVVHWAHDHLRHQ